MVRQPLSNSSSASTNMSSVGPAPTIKPPTPPAVIRATGSLSKGSREYRTPPAVAPPQVPSHYAPNYPLGHVRREKGPGYNTLPLHHTSSSNNIQSAPIIGMVHPMQQSEQPSSLNSMPRKLFCINYILIINYKITIMLQLHHLLTH